MYKPSYKKQHKTSIEYSRESYQTHKKESRVGVSLYFNILRFCFFHNYRKNYRKTKIPLNIDQLTYLKILIHGWRDIWKKKITTHSHSWKNTYKDYKQNIML